MRSSSPAGSAVNKPAALPWHHNVSRSRCYSLKSPGKSPKIRLSPYLHILRLGGGAGGGVEKDSKRRQPPLPSAQEGWHHFSRPSPLAFPGTSQKRRFYTPGGWTSFSSQRGFFPPRIFWEIILWGCILSLIFKAVALFRPWKQTQKTNVYKSKWVKQTNHITGNVFFFSFHSFLKEGFSHTFFKWPTPTVLVFIF